MLSQRFFSPARGFSPFSKIDIIATSVIGSWIRRNWCDQAKKLTKSLPFFVHVGFLPKNDKIATFVFGK